jgi:hypothetical protein
MYGREPVVSEPTMSERAEHAEAPAVAHRVGRGSRARHLTAIAAVLLAA